MVLGPNREPYRKTTPRRRGRIPELGNNALAGTTEDESRTSVNALPYKRERGPELEANALSGTRAASRTRYYTAPLKGANPELEANTLRGTRGGVLNPRLTHYPIKESDGANPRLTRFRR